MPPKPAYKRGDVILVLFPHSDLRTAKPRPALVVQADNLQTGLPQVVIAMITADYFARITQAVSLCLFLRQQASNLRC